jgi:hypothetical protein
MFVACTDETAGVMVGMYCGTETDDEGHARCVASVGASDAAAAAKGLASVCIIVTQYDTPPPPPIWRQRMADSNKELRAKHHYFALVCPNPLQRGVLTAILWLTGAPKNHRYAAFATFADAVAWTQHQAERSYPMMNLLYEQAYALLQDATRKNRDVAPHV